VFYRIFYWPIRLLDWAGTRTVRLFGLHPSGEHASIYTQTSGGCVDIPASELEPEQRQLTPSRPEFGELGVREAMSRACS